MEWSSNDNFFQRLSTWQDFIIFFISNEILSKYFFYWQLYMASMRNHRNTNEYIANCLCYFAIPLNIYEILFLDSKVML